MENKWPVAGYDVAPGRSIGAPGTPPTPAWLGGLQEFALPERRRML